MGCIMERLPQGTVKEEMGTKGQRKFSPMVTSMVESGGFMKFYTFLYAGTQTHKHSSLGSYYSVTTDNGLPESTGE